MKSITGSGTMYFILSLRLRARLQYNKDKLAIFLKVVLCQEKKSYYCS